MINAGFNPLQQISEKTGKSISQLKEEMSKGAISAEMVQQAFLDATAAGGKFYNMSENASKTINGQISMMQDAMDAVFNEIGTKTEGVIIKSIQTATTLIQNYEKIGKVLIGLVTTYGTYRTAVLLSTAATSKHTIAEIALTNVRIAARKAQQALNAAMLTNPYVALTVAVGGLVTAFVALRDNSTAAERAQEKYNKSKEEAAKNEQEHISAIQNLIDKANDEAVATHKRQEALDDLKTQYRDIFGDYDLEALKLANTRDLLREVNAEYDRKQQKSRESEYSELNSFISSNAGRNLGKAGQKLYEEKVELRGNMRNDFAKERVAEYASILEKQTDEYLQKALAMANAASEGKAAFQIMENLNITGDEKIDLTSLEKLNIEGENLKNVISAINKEIKNREEAPFFADDYEAARKKWETAKEELEKIEKDKKNFRTKQYQAAKSAVETAEKEFKALGGDTTSKSYEDAVQAFNERLAQQEKDKIAQERSDKERARTVKDNEFMVEQARISAMKEGAERTRAQQALDNEKELESLERQKQDYIEKVVEAEKAIFDAQEEQKAKNDKKYKKKAFDFEVSRVSVDTKAYDDAIAYTRAKQVAQEDSFVKNLYNQYKSYEDKKKDLEKSYLDDILALNSEYLMTGDEKYIRSINERNKAYVQALNKLESEYGTEEYKLIFGDPSKMTGDTIERALEAARKKMSQLNKDSDPEAFQALSEAIDKLEDARDNNPFQGWDTSVMGLVQKLYQIRNIRKDIADYEKEGNTEAAEAAKGQLEKSKKDLNRALVGTGVALFGDALSTAAASMKEVAKASGDIHLEQQAEALEKAGGFVSSVASGAASGGWIGAIVGGATSLMNMLISSITESEVVAARAKKAYEDYLDELSHTARTINDEDYETIFGVRVLDRVVDASRAAQDAYRQYEEYVNKPRKKGHWGNNGAWINETDLRSMIVFEGKNQDYKNALKSLTLGEKFSELFDEETGELNMEEARRILEAYSEYSNENWYKALSDATEALQDYKDNLKVVDDYLTSLFSNVGSEIADAIMQGNDALEVLEDNAGRIFASIAKDMIMSVLMSGDFIEEYKKRLRDAMATEDTADDADALAAFVDELGLRIDEAKDQWEKIKAIAEERGIEMNFGESDTQQNATSRGYQTLSEDTGNELVGRALAQYESNLRMEESMRMTKESVDLMVANQVQIRDIAAESRALIADSYLELQQIRENTGAIIKPIKNLSEKIDKWDTKIMGL